MGLQQMLKKNKNAVNSIDKKYPKLYMQILLDSDIFFKIVLSFHFSQLIVLF